MAGRVNVTYEPAPDGGVFMVFDMPDSCFHIPMSRQEAIQTAANILGTAGVTHATLENGRMDAYS